MKFSEILQKNNELGKSLTSATYDVALLSNTIINQLNPILEYELRSDGINAKSISGDYDNILQDSAKYSSSKLVVVFWEMANLTDGFQYRSNVLSEEETEQYITRFKSEIDFVLANLAPTQLVLINKFSTLIFNHHYIRANNFDVICDALNKHLQQNCPANAVIIDIDKIIAKTGVNNAVDYRNYYSSKALYSVEFLRAYAAFVKPVVLSVAGKAKKALIFDCDNTLWNGIIGEDGMEGIYMSPSSPKGVVYEEVQFLAKELAKRGIIIGLNTKNNPADVEEVLKQHKDLRLTEDEIIIKRVNWNDKAGNLKEIAESLNIGIDSLVFIDDSDFEINLIHEYLPQVATIQVPKERYMYPYEVRKHLHLFYNKTISAEDAKRAKMYKEENSRESAKSSYDSIEGYLQSLDLKLTLYTNSMPLMPRMAQLTQKTNQFNFTTKRYTEADVTRFVTDDSHMVFAFDVKDKFGEFGITGQAFIEIQGDTAIWDTFLMSCRVLGRKIEYRFVDEVIKALQQAGVKKIKASYIKTPKNDQVKDFYEGIGFTITEQTDDYKHYELDIENYQYHTLDYITVSYE